MKVSSVYTWTDDTAEGVYSQTTPLYQCISDDTTVKPLYICLFLCILQSNPSISACLYVCYSQTPLYLPVSD